MAETQFWRKLNNGHPWFFGCEDPASARDRYRRLAKMYHPDVNPNKPDATSIMQEINAHYERDMRGFSGQTFGQSDKSEREYTYTYNHAQEASIQAIIVATLALHMHGVCVELVGSWVWVYGKPDPNSTRAYKDHLKALGYKWSGKRKRWYYTASTYRRRASKADFETIRARYGSRVYQEAD